MHLASFPGYYAHKSYYILFSYGKENLIIYKWLAFEAIRWHVEYSLF